MKYKCLDCFLGYIDEENLVNGCCPECNSDNLAKHCEKDVPCHCAKTIHETVTFCDECGEPVCPGCGCHDVEQISRVTGYLQTVKSWNSAKQQELKDRTRYEPETGNVCRGVI